MPNTPRLMLASLLAAAAIAVQPLAVAHAAPAANLPDWDAAKPKPKPAELPDWDAAKPKPKDKKKPKKPKAGGEAVEAPPSETPPEEAPPAEATPAEAPVETPSEAPPEAAPAESTPAPAPVVEGPAEAPAVDTGGTKEQLRVARGELIVGGVLLGVGVGGLGMLGAGAALKGSDNADTAKTGTTLLTAGAIVGVIGTVMGLALLGEGIKDRRAARGGATARVRVAPTFAGLALSGRF